MRKFVAADLNDGGGDFTTFSPVGAVASLRLGSLFMPTSIAPGSAAGACQADGTGNQQ